jgi:hypothetical protein
MRAKILISVVFAAAGCSHTKSVTPEPEPDTSQPYVVFRPRFVPSTSCGDEDSRLPVPPPRENLYENNMWRGEG